MKIYDTLDLLNPPPGAVLGNHGLWLPSYDGRSLKIPHQHGGRICKRTRPQEPSYPRDSIVDEVKILRALAEQQMAPPVGELVFFRNVISDYPGSALWIDPCGAYGYEIADARTLPPGRFSIEAMRKLPIEGSPGAWNDILVPERGNVVNGYLIDVRRTAWDMLRWTGPRFELPDAREPAEELRARVHRECQFPAGERAEAYQDFWLRGWIVRGQRRVTERALALGFAPGFGETVLDIGCQSGSFLQYAWRSAWGHSPVMADDRCVDIGGGGQPRGLGRFVGVDISPAYVDCARALARSCGQNLCIRQMDVVRQREEFLAWVRALFPGGKPDHVLALSLEKHIQEPVLFSLIDAIGARTTYIETNAVKDRGHLKLWDYVKPRGGVHVGFSEDRNLRVLYRIERTG